MPRPAAATAWATCGVPNSRTRGAGHPGPAECLVQGPPRVEVPGQQQQRLAGQLGQRHRVAFCPGVIRPDLGPDGQLGQRDGAQPVRWRGGADDEVGSAGQRVVHPRGDLLPDGGQRVVGAQGREERRDDVGEGRARCGDGEVLHPAGRDRGRRLAGRGGLCHEVPRDRQEGPPGGAEREPPVAPVEEVDAEVVLELAQLARQGRLGDVHRAGGRRDRAGVGDGQEVAEGAQLHGDASWAWERCGSGIGQHGTVGCTLSADAGRCRDPVPTAPRGAPMPSTPVEQRRRLVTAIPGPRSQELRAASSRPCPPVSAPRCRSSSSAPAAASSSTSTATR